MINAVKDLAENILNLLTSNGDWSIINSGGVTMDRKNLVITEFLSASKPINHQGQIICINDRISSALIFPIYGKLEFSTGTEVIIADSEHPIFIPRGISYTNRCLEEAKSYMFSIQVQSYPEKITSLLSTDKRLLHRIFDEIAVLNANCTLKKQVRILERLYHLIGECLPEESGDTSSILSPALEAIEKNYHLAELSLDDLATSCNISKAYLFKLFKKEFNTSPFKYITQIRMEQAKVLLLEMYPVGEVAAMVGYSDIYQFSRAFKRFYNCSPDRISPGYPC